MGAIGNLVASRLLGGATGALALLLVAGCSGGTNVDATNTSGSNSGADNSSAGGSEGGGGLFGMGGSADTSQLRDGAWRVSFSGSDVSYAGEYRPSNGDGPMVLSFTSQGANGLIRQTCRMNGDSDIHITCRDAVVLSGNVTYSPDSFTVRRDGDQRLSGTIALSSGANAPASFDRGGDTSIPADAWTQPGRPGGPVASAPGGDLHGQLEGLATQIRAGLPIGRGILRFTAVGVNDTQLIMNGTITVSLDQATWARIETSLQHGACRQPTHARILQAGASIRYVLTDRDGTTRSAVISHC